MKAVIVAVLVLLVVSQSEALICFCRGLRQCSSSEETCVGTANACISVIFFAGPDSGFYKGCASLYACSLMKQYGGASVSCCTTDLCNW